MRINRKDINGDTIAQIYISEKEKNNKEIQKQIEEIKKKSKNIVVFVSGMEEISKHLEYIIKYIKLKQVI